MSGASTHDYIPVATLDQVPPGKGRVVFVGSRMLALFNIRGEIFALDDTCPHAGSSLGCGRLKDSLVTCRAHGLRFDVHPVRVTGNQIAVALEATPGAATPEQRTHT
jgi:phenylpropionate dioxygenase-like ring-hydroxylating dioxygenase large terminal subunit